MVRNYQIMSTRVRGARQARNEIRHIICGSRVFYGIPGLAIFTVGKHHSGLAIHIFRGLRRDPFFTQVANNAFIPWIGYTSPSLQPHSTSEEHVTVDLSEHGVRRLITSRDPLCCVHAFQVFIRVVTLALYGFQMCPDCRMCAQTDCPCMDEFGSIAAPMGGAVGRCDATVGAVEAQKAEGVLHIHTFMYLQNACRLHYLNQLGTMVRGVMISANAFKEFISYVRSAKYPGAERFESVRNAIAKAWPAYHTDTSLPRLQTLFLEPCSDKCKPKAWEL